MIYTWFGPEKSWKIICIRNYEKQLIWIKINEMYWLQQSFHLCSHWLGSTWSLSSLNNEGAEATSALNCKEATSGSFEADHRRGCDCPWQRGCWDVAPLCVSTRLLLSRAVKKWAVMDRGEGDNEHWRCRFVPLWWNKNRLELCEETETNWETKLKNPLRSKGNVRGKCEWEEGSTRGQEVTTRAGKRPVCSVNYACRSFTSCSLTYIQLLFIPRLLLSLSTETETTKTTVSISVTKKTTAPTMHLAREYLRG